MLSLYLASIHLSLLLRSRIGACAVGERRRVSDAVKIENCFIAFLIFIGIFLSLPHSC